LANSKVINAHLIESIKEKSSITGIIFDIERFALHDGPGIRITVFLKGCPLTCWWCQNPEGRDISTEIMFWADRCISCLTCEKVCPNVAISHLEGIIITSRDKCTLCGTCIEACPSGAREVIGKKMTVSEVMKEIEKDVIFYDESGGGATFSGGEPLMQPDFLNSLLLSCREQRIHTVVDTSGYAETRTLLNVSKNVDLFLYDLKLIDDDKHKRFTGVSNALILSNLRELSLHHDQIVIRVPIIPEINDDEENVSRIAEFVASLQNVTQIDILPFNKLSIDKHKRLQRPYLLKKQSLSNERINEIEERLRRFGFKVQIGR